jgi:hypothetical protein
MCRISPAVKSAGPAGVGFSGKTNKCLRLGMGYKRAVRLTATPRARDWARSKRRIPTGIHPRLRLAQRGENPAVPFDLLREAPLIAALRNGLTALGGRRTKERA